MSVISMKQLLEAGVHFGHQTRRWNPKMAPYIYTERNGIYIIDLQKSVGKVDEAYKAVSDIVAEDGKQTVAKYLEEVSKAVGGTVKVKRFVRFETGEGLEKKQEDFAAEVAAQMNA